jgi:SSS family transporter
MGILDWTLCVAAVALLFAQGWYLARGQKTTEDYFVGGRRMNWLAVGLSMFATIFSPLSFVGLPREAAYANYHLYLAILFIPLFAAPLAGWLFVPLFHRLRLTSAYEYLQMRFDWRLRQAASLLYGLYLLFWMGTMLHATAMMAQAALGLSEPQRIATLLVLGAMTATYTALGGYKATVWTNVVKAAVLAGVVVTFLLLAVGRVEGGFAAVFQIGREHHKFAMLDFRWDLSSGAAFFPACAFGVFVYGAVAVAAQGSVQRYASTPTVADARRLLAVNGIGTAFVCLLFFLLGSTMFAYYTQHPDPAGSAAKPFPPLPKEDQVTVHFIQTVLDHPALVGLFLAALLTTAMGSVSGGLNALSSLIVCDWLSGRQMGVRQGRLMTAVFGAATIATALVAPYLGEHVFKIIIRISGAFFGPLFGLFLLAALVRRANASGALIGLAAGLVSLAVIFPFPDRIDAWWYGAFTCLPTLMVGSFASLFFPPPAPEKLRGLTVFGTPAS